jgi:hypothetical protein
MQHPDETYETYTWNAYTGVELDTHGHPSREQQMETWHFYIIVGYTRNLLMCYISTIGERVKEHGISCKIETWHGKHRINFYLPSCEFEIGLYVNFGKLWNVKFQAKYISLLSRFQFL